MGLRAKVVLFTAGFLIALLAVLFVVASRVLVEGFAAVEVQSMRNSVQTFEGHMPFEYFEVSSRIHELAPQEEVYAFAENADPEFVETYLSPDRLAALNLTFVALLDSSHRIIHWTDSSPELAVTAVVPGAFESVLPQVVLQRTGIAASGNEPTLVETATTRSGLLMVADMPAIVAARSFASGESGSRVDGTLILGRVLDERQVALIEDLMHVGVELRLWNSASLTGDMANARDRIAAGEDRPVIPLDGDTIAGYAQLRSVAGEPMLLARVVRPRPVFAQAQDSQRALLGFTGLVGIVFAAMIFGAVQRGLLSRFATLSRDLGRIATDRDSSLRVEVSGRDELARVGRDVNTMLGALAASEEALRESETRYALAAEGGNDGIWDWDLRTERVYYSPRWRAILGLTDRDDEDLGLWLDRIHPDDRLRVERELDLHREGRSGHFENEHRLLHADGNYRWVLVRGKAIFEGDHPVRMAGSLTDITERGLFDPLTGLPNAVLLRERVEQTISQSQSGRGLGGALVGVAVARLEAIEESLGQAAADEVSIEVARRLRTTVATTETVAKTGVDEFVVLIENVDSARELTEVATGIKAVLEQPILLGEREIDIGAGLGILTDLPSYTRVEDALRDVGIATQRAIESREPFVFFDTSMFQEAMESRRIEMDLRGAGERGELFLEYQPVVDMATEETLWHEALVRWRHPQRGLLSPGVFIPLAEESGAIVSVGAWVLRAACHDLARMTAEGGRASISVNLSSKQIFDPTLIDMIQRVIEDVGIDPEDLSFEVTETALMEDAEMAASILSRLKELGVGIVMDDFGTGYSSLSYIHTLPLDKIKIDRSFVSAMTDDMTSLEIVRTIIGLAHTLGLTVVAEGIETRKQASLLRDLGCAVGQGFLYARPKSLGR